MSDFYSKPQRQSCRTCLGTTFMYFERFEWVREGRVRGEGGRLAVSPPTASVIRRTGFAAGAVQEQDPSIFEDSAGLVIYLKMRNVPYQLACTLADYYSIASRGSPRAWRGLGWTDSGVEHTNGVLGTASCSLAYRVASLLDVRRDLRARSSDCFPTFLRACDAVLHKARHPDSTRESFPIYEHISRLRKHAWTR